MIYKIKNILSLLFIILFFNSFAQYKEIIFFPGDSLHKEVLSEYNGNLYCLAKLYGYSEYLFKSSDNGNTWTQLKHFTGGIIHAMDMASFNDSCHIAVSKHGIFKTNDYFDSTHIVMANFNIFSTTIKAVNYDTVLIFDKSKIYLSYDHFNTWDTIDFNDVSSSKYSIITDDIFIINDTIWYSYLAEDGYLIKTVNAGKDWSIERDFSSYSFYEGILIDFYSENDAIIYIDDTDELYITHDKGHTFQSIHHTQIISTYPVDIKAFSSGWIYIMKNFVNHQEIFFSGDYGSSWNSVKYDNTNDIIWNIYLFNDTTILALTNSGKLLKFDMGIISSVNDNFLNDNIQIYPNPTTDFLHIEVLDRQMRNCIIYDVLGNVIEESVFYDKSLKLNVKSFENGVYFIKIINENNNLVSINKFIKQ